MTRVSVRWTAGWIPCLLLAFFLTPALAGGDAQLDQGEAQLRHRQFTLAVQTFRQALATDPHSLHAHLGYQEASVRAGSADKVLAEYEQAWQNAAGDPQAAFLYARLLPADKAAEVLGGLKQTNFYTQLETARVLHAQGKRGEDDVLEALVSEVPQDPRDLGLLAGAFEDLGDVKDALATWQKAQTLAPDRIEVLVGMAECDRRLEAYEDALRLLKRATQLDKQDPEISYRLALTLRDKGDFEEALKALAPALEMAPRDVDILLLQGGIEMSLERYADAEKVFASARQADPAREDAIFRLAECYEAEDKNDESLALYKDFLIRHPLDARPHKAIGWIDIKKGKFDEALAEFKQAYDLDSSDVMPLYLSGYVYDRMGRWGEAEDTYTKLVKAQPDHAWGWHNLGLAQKMLGHDSKALSSLGKAVDLSPDNAYFRLDYGHALLGSKKYKDALEQFQAVVDKDEKSLHGWMGVGLANVELRKYKPAADAYEKVLALEPDDADLHLEVGLIYGEYLKDYEKAVDHYEKYLSLGGADPAVQAWVDELKRRIR